MLISNLNLLAKAPGGVARLRELILTLAVQGKLVPQDAAEEPASVLLLKIREEKERLIAARALKREKNQPALTDEQLPFELPDSWTWVALGEVIDIVRGITFSADQKTKEAAPGRIACLRTSNVQQTIEWDDLLFVNRSFMGREDQLIQHHDIVMSMANSRELVGKVALVEQVPHAEATFGGFLGVLRPRKIEPRYAMAVLRTSFARSLLIDSSSQTTNIANISLAKLRPLPFPLPPEAEQSRIVTRVEELMRLCDTLEAKGKLEATQHAQLVNTLLGTLTVSTTPEELADNWQRVSQHFDLLLDRPEAIDALEQTLLQLAVRGLLVPQDAGDEPASTLLARIRSEKDRLIAEGKVKRDKPLPPITAEEQPFELPIGWAWVRLGFLGESFDYGSSQKSVDDSAAVPILRMGNIQGGRVFMNNLKYLKDTRGELPHLALHEGDLLFNRTNSYELVGKTGIFEGYSREVTFASYLIRIRLMGAWLNPEYINAYMNTLDCRKNEIEPDLTQQTGQANYNGTKLKSIRVPLPPLAEQSRIVTRITALRRLCADLRQRLKAAQATQSHLAQALVESSNTL
ncbi:restriction endonuclease subunit S [Delftia acidovorans]|uniref:restriction endonuclease subunit S n=1 Tax=Delftia acidovorans TaxID=80866 RepID=UPI0030189263